MLLNQEISVVILKTRAHHPVFTRISKIIYLEIDVKIITLLKERISIFHTSK